MGGQKMGAFCLCLFCLQMRIEEKLTSGLCWPIYCDLRLRHDKTRAGMCLSLDLGRCARRFIPLK